MFLRKEIKTIKTNSYKRVPFCKDCNSNDVEVIQTCKKCGSHNIGYPSFIDLCSKDNRGMIPIYEDKELYIYKCDKCGKEFDGLNEPNIISYGYDEFVLYKMDDDDCKIYTLSKDLCNDCKKLLVNKLNRQLEEIIDKDNVLNILNNL